MQTIILLWVTFRTDWNKEVRAMTFIPPTSLSFLFYSLKFGTNEISGRESQTPAGQMGRC